MSERTGSTPADVLYCRYLHHFFREIVDTYKFIDRSKICVWGWSFGGYLTTKVLALDGENSIMQVKLNIIMYKEVKRVI